MSGQSYSKSNSKNNALSPLLSAEKRRIDQAAVSQFAIEKTAVNPFVECESEMYVRSNKSKMTKASTCMFTDR